MDIKEKTLRAAGPRIPSTPLTSTTASRRALHRVETAAMDIKVSLRMGDDMVVGHLLNISTGGCSVRVALPVYLVLDTDITFDVTLPAGEEYITCPGDFVGLDGGQGTARLRLRFHSLAPETHRALLLWISELVTRDFQLRHTGGKREWSIGNRG